MCPDGETRLGNGCLRRERGMVVVGVSGVRSLQEVVM